jgi:bifunctional UDP-N-acetylglucosamine pyrophosphorylase/glucosamine-1-phosphate N-acetyltransferase
MSAISGVNQQPESPVAAIILAAGKSTRMRSKLPKPLHPLCGLPMTGHVIEACRSAGVSRIVVVVGHEADSVQKGLGDNIEYALQEIPRGTGDAVRSARSLFSEWQGTILVLAGDVPLLPSTTLRALIAHQQQSGASATMLTAFLDDPTGYGRIVRDESGSVKQIIEHKDADPEQRAIREWNPSIYAFDSEALWSSLDQIRPNNVQGEFYLTDTIGILNNQGRRVDAIPADNSDDVLGVNNRVELAAAAAILQQRILTNLMLSGVSITDPANTYIETGVEIGQDSIIEPNTYLYRGTRIGEDCIIGPMSRIVQSTIGRGTRIVASQVVESVLEEDVKVGPFAHLRPGTHLGSKVKIGDFVETKNAVFGPGAQASHLTYIGDAEVGAGTNVGAGTITCNYDGYFKHRTTIGKNAFIGSHSTLIAPVTIGDGAFIAAGSVVTVNVPNDALAIARSHPTLKEGWAANYRAARAMQLQAGKKTSKPE